MKHLISLSFKYLRRQKLRSVLTFLCIMLAIFILNTFSAYCSSTLATLVNFEQEESGSWHVNFDHALKYSEKQDEITNILDHHAVVEDYYYSAVDGLWSLGDRMADGYIRYVDITFDNGTRHIVHNLVNRQKRGNPAVLYNKEQAGYMEDYSYLTENSAVFPAWVQELGYEVGDTITMTMTPVKASIPADSEYMQGTLDWIKENSPSGTNYFVTDGEEVSPKAEGMNEGHALIHYLLKAYTPEELQLPDRTAGTPISVTMTIGGFQKDSWNGSDFTLDLNSHPVNDFDLDALFSGENEALLLGSIIHPYHERFCSVRIGENIEFDDGVEMLFTDLGIDKTHFYDLSYHDALLAFEIRSANAIAAIMPYIVAMLLMALVAWAICRFVIDNAFEISVQERSAQFAVLRIMGASRAQLLALIFTEAIFYCLTAVPLGIYLAFYSCKTVMDLLGGSVFPLFTFDVNPYITIIGILLGVVGILISAYTSAMWAARKLSPLETLQYGKPKKKAAKQKQHKSNLHRKARGFVLDYTMKNISRTKNRYLISTIAMALGIIMFTFSTLGISFIKNAIQTQNEKSFTYDYAIDLPSCKEKFLTRANELFADSEYFSAYELYITGAFESGRYAEEMDALQALMPNGQEAHGWGMHMIRLISRSQYEKYIAPSTDMTYDEFKESGAAIIYASSGGSPDEYEWDESGYLIRKQEDGYWSYEDQGLAEPPTISFRNSSETIPVIGSVCFDRNSMFLGESELMIADFSTIPEELVGSMSGCFNLTVNGHENYEQAKQMLDTYTSEIKGCSVEDNYMANTGLVSFCTAIFRTLSIFLVSVWLVGVLTMVNSINTSVLNRQNELIMLRAVGMTKRQLQGTVVLEGILYSALSTILGIIIGVSGYLVFVKYIGFEDLGGDMMKGLVLPILLTVLGTLLLNLVIAALAAIPGLDSLSKRLKV